ncbi:MAG: acyl-ACP--UDP-N-acetylglucosamine O-acyltransferase [Gammaproteobacteria bacterium]|nr:acyl-ACP--UDP-N-acetylglucosamine O-acyltransferase [Gammaproteobacteria bacterium]
MIHKTAIVDPAADIDSSAVIGPYSVIGADVHIGPQTIVGSHSVVKGPTTIGKDNHIYQFCSIGEDPQDKKYSGEKESVLKIGNGNVIREYCTLNRGTEPGGGVTSLGDNNWIMAYVHIAHDCIIGNRNTFANNTTLAGHVVIDSDVIFGGFTGIHQFCHIGSYAFTAISSVIVKDVPPFLMVTGNTAKPCGLNKEGLKRHGFNSQRINDLRKAYRILYREGLIMKDAMIKLAKMAESNGDIALLVNFIYSSERGIIR